MAGDIEIIEAQVLIVGAGPVGLMLAGELRLGGAEVVVWERRRDPSGESRATHLNTRTMEILDQRGLLNRLGRPRRDGAGHFGGVPLDHTTVVSSYAGQWYLPQSRLEAALEQWVREHGARVLRAYELTQLVATEGRVHAWAAAGGRSVRARAGFLVGCDGEESTVRRLAGFPFPGTDATTELFRADVAGISVRERRLEPSVAGLASAARRTDGVTRIMVHVAGRQPRPRTGPPTFSEVAAAWRRVAGEDISGGTPIWIDAFVDTSRQAAQYRRGRVLLAGDAAHRQLPTAGQALNLGLQDAVNLGWKLAAEVRGRVPTGLLDTYHDERHRVGARVLSHVRAQALLLLGTEQTAPLRTVVGELMEFDEVRAHLSGMVSGVDVRYDVGSGEHPLLGRRLPAFPLMLPAGETSTLCLLREACGVLLDLSNDPARQERLAGAVAGLDGAVRLVSATCPLGGPLAGVSALLVRPDGHVVWVDPGAGELTAALSHWFGPPSGTIHKVDPMRMIGANR